MYDMYFVGCAPLWIIVCEVTLFYCFIGVVIEEITEEEHIVSSENWESSTKDFSVNEPQETSGSSKGQSEIHAGPTTNLDYLQALQDDPDSIRFACIHQ